MGCFAVLWGGVWGALLELDGRWGGYSELGGL